MLQFSEPFGWLEPCVGVNRKRFQNNSAADCTVLRQLAQRWISWQCSLSCLLGWEFQSAASSEVEVDRRIRKGSEIEDSKGKGAGQNGAGRLSLVRQQRKDQMKHVGIKYYQMECLMMFNAYQCITVVAGTRREVSPLVVTASSNPVSRRQEISRDHKRSTFNIFQRLSNDDKGCQKHITLDIFGQADDWEERFSRAELWVDFVEVQELHGASKFPMRKFDRSVCVW